MSKMFAVVNQVDQTPIWVKQGEVGYWPCTVEQMEAWRRMNEAQGSDVTESAYGASIIGWDAPIAELAVKNARAST